MVLDVSITCIRYKSLQLGRPCGDRVEKAAEGAVLSLLSRVYSYTEECASPGHCLSCKPQPSPPCAPVTPLRASQHLSQHHRSRVTWMARRGEALSKQPKMSAFGDDGSDYTCLSTKKVAEFLTTPECLQASFWNQGPAETTSRG